MSVEQKPSGNFSDANVDSDIALQERKDANLSSTLVADDEDTSAHLSGWRLRGVMLSLSICAFLAVLDITIIATALVDITKDLQNFEISSWIVTAYMLTYNGFLIIWAKFSDILGRKSCTAAALIIFIIFSGACGAAQTMTQLAIFRAFQGIGGSGLTAMSFVIIPEMVHTSRYALFSSLMAIAFAFSYLCGPLVGGAICNNTTWRWIFLINCPIGAFAFVLLFIFLPNGFPHHTSPATDKRRQSSSTIRQILTRIDYIGTMTLFGLSAFLVAALQEAGTRYAWSSATIIVLLVFSGIFCIAFLVWEFYLTKHDTPQEEVFTWRLITNRVFMGSVAMSFLGGSIWTVAVIQIPQRFQTVNGVSPLNAGVKLLPFTLLASVGVILSSILASKLRIPAIIVVFIGSAFQTISVGLMSTLPEEVGSQNYGYEALLSLGLGMVFGMMTLLMPQLIRGKDQSVAMGANTQFRSMGGVIGLAIAVNVLNSVLKSRLCDVLSEAQLAALLQSVTVIESFPAELQDAVQAAFVDGYNLNMKIMIGFGAAQVLLLALMWEKPIRRVV